MWFARHSDVAAHFAGRSTPAEDRKLFAHAKTCARCRDEYRTYALLEAMEPGGDERARARLHRGVFESAAPAPRRRAVGAGLVLAFGCLALVASFGRGPAAFRARGGGVQTIEPSLAIYRVPRDREDPTALAPDETQRAGSVVHAGESLAFSYTNPQAVSAGYLMVFGIDAAGRVYWYWPAWNDAALDPASLPIPASDAAIELPEAVRHPLVPGPLTIVGLFTPQPLHVREVETALAKGLPGLQAFEGHIWTESLEVSP
ncbi:MAG TPA: hypothetical protein VHJ20_10730 [Polyangia bacterium]|nr:hypothetical protein [Polyangia bacterium]